MAAEDQLDVQLNLITSGANKALDGLSKSFTTAFKGLNTDLGKTTLGLGTVTKSLFSVKTAAVAAGATILAFLGSKNVINGAIESEEAINSVALALARTGQYTEESLGSLEDWANQLQKNTVYAGGEILKQTNLALAYDITAEQAQRVTEASIELAAATGRTLDEATATVTKTLGGMSGELGKLNPRIKALTSEQLKNGEAARILLEQYGGTAIGRINTFGGALKQNRNVMADFTDKIGELITKNPVVVAGIKALTDVFASMAKYLDDNRKGIIAFVNEGIVTLLKAAPQVGEFFKFMVSSLTIITKSLSMASAGVGIIVQSLLQFGPIKVLFDGLVATISLVVGGIIDLIGVLVQLPGVSDTLEAMGFNAEDLSASLSKAANATYDLFNSANADVLTQGIEKANDFAFSIADGATEVKDNLNKAIDEGVVKAGKLADAVSKLASQGEVKLKVVNNEEETKRSIDNYQQLLETAFGGERGAKVGGALVSGIVSGLKSGKEGARNLISSVSGAIADAFLPGLGAVAGPLVDVLSQGPEAVKQMVKDFTGAIPDLIENIILAIPVLVEEFANALPVIVERLAEKAPMIIEALVKQAPSVALALAKQAPMIALALAKEVPRVIQAMIAAIGDAIKKFLGLGDSGGKGISGSGGGGGVGGALSTGPTKNGYVNTGLNIITLGGSGAATATYNKLKKVFGFAKGGEVPDGFPNDTMPAKLSSGELVIDRSTNKDLKDFLKGGASQTDALLARMISLLEAPQVVSSSVQLNGREFANIILQLNRTQQRIS